MSFILASRVRETTTTTGTGSITLAGAVTGYQTFASGIGLNNQTYYTIADQSGNNWEVGSGTVTSGVLSRDTIYASSNSNALVNFTAGTKDVFCDYPAYSAVAQKDVGTNANQIPLNQYLGTMAWQDAKAVRLGGDAVINTLTVGLGGGQIATNTVVGNGAGNANTTGSLNTYYGYQTGFKTTTGSPITFIGTQTGYNNTTGGDLVGVGYRSLYSNTTGFTSTGVGNYSLFNNTTGNYSVAYGYYALFSNTSGNNNTAFGTQAGYGNASANANTTGVNNTYIGYQTVGSANNNSNEMVIGYQAVGLGSNTTVIGNSSTVRTKVFGTVETTGYTVATLPTGVVGMRAYVTNALSPSYGATVVGGGAVTIPVFYNGTNWICA